MGWGSGSRLMSNIIDQLEQIESLTPEDKKSVYNAMIVDFEDQDCDTLDECLGVSEEFDAVYYELYPDRKEDVEDEEE